VLELWKDAGVDIENDKGAWYKSTGQGMGAALNLRIVVKGDPAQWAALVLSQCEWPGGLNQAPTVIYGRTL
jgi:hypothetical protein